MTKIGNKAQYLSLIMIQYGSKEFLWISGFGKIVVLETSILSKKIFSKR